MDIWKIVYYPAPGERNSPMGYIANLSNKEGQATLIHRLKFLCQNELADWPHTWCHKITGKVYQLTAGASRVMFCLDDNRLVILHACKKVGQKTRSQDIERAERHYELYLATREGRND